MSTTTGTSVAEQIAELERAYAESERALTTERRLRAEAEEALRAANLPVPSEKP